VRQRGFEIGNALLDGFTDVAVLLSIGYVELFRATCLNGEPFDKSKFALLPAFLDGLERARFERRSGAILVDAFLPAYPTKLPDAFRMFRDLIHFRWDDASLHWVAGVVTYTFPDGSDAWAGAAPWPDRPRLLCSDEDRRRLSRDLAAGFGLMVDYEHSKRGGFRTDPAEFKDNYFTPPELTAAVAAALRASDGYVWLWTSTLDWWTVPGAKTLAPGEYTRALTQARAGKP
jgi:hypothetical protein